MSDVEQSLADLAHAYDVATEYWDWRGVHVQVAASTLVAVLAALGVDASTSQTRQAALLAWRERAWTRMLPPYVVTRAQRETPVQVHVTHGRPVDVWIVFEDGSLLVRVPQAEDFTPPRAIGGREVGQATFVLPADLPLGYHRLHAYSDGQENSALLMVTPSWVGLPARAGARKLWGLTTQLYSAVSRRSWGVGDLTDLADLAGWAGAEHDAAFVLVNPLHAAEPVAPMEPSPYLPTTRRFANPLYLRVEDIAEYAYLDAPARARIEAIHADLTMSQAGDRTDRDRADLINRDRADLIDRDRVWTAKRAALEIVRGAGLTPGRQLAFDAFCRREGDALTDFATWAALVDEHGADYHDWPAELRHPMGAAVARFRAQHQDRIDLHRWLQWVLDEQLDLAQAAACRAGMALGIVHDLAVGVSPNGSDAWARQDDLACGITVGAPPDAYNQLGQNWTQPPWRPDRLADTAYAPFRELVANVLRHAGGLRVDHIIGLFRLWWIPAGAAPTAGTYVRYDHDALVGILALEAERADAVVIGEDLGTVEPWVRDYLRERGLLGTSILWFERDFDHPGADGSAPPLAAEQWREYCLASVTTHDLPPTAGYLTGEHVRLRDRLGLLSRPLDEELAADRADQTAWLAELRHRGLLAAAAAIDDADADADIDVDIDETVLALHRYLSAAPSRLRSLALTDAVGDRRTQNQPGTSDEYPNWRVPLTGPDGERIWLEDVFTSARAAALAEAMRGGT